MGFFSRIFSRQAEAEPAAPIVKLLLPDRGLPRPILQFLIDNKLLLSSWLTLSDLEDELMESFPGLRALIKNCK